MRTHANTDVEDRMATGKQKELTAMGCWVFSELMGLLMGYRPSFTSAAQPVEVGRLVQMGEMTQRRLLGK